MVHYFQIPSNLGDGCTVQKVACCKNTEKEVDKADVLNAYLTGRAAGPCGSGVVGGVVTCFCQL